MKLVILLFASILLQSCMPKARKPEAACGFRQNVYGERISWKGGSPVKMRLHSSVPDRMIPAIKSAAETWNEAAGRQIIQIVDSPRFEGKNDYNKDFINVISFKAEWPQDKERAQAETRIAWIGDEAVEADIVINGYGFGFYWGPTVISQPLTSGYWSMVNIEALILHEFGHALGLVHSDSSTSVMYSYLSSGSDRIALDPSSTQSLKCEY